MDYLVTMRLAIISDIHSNYPALTKALSFIDRSRIDQIYCLGDIVGYGASPNECVALVRERAVAAVLGNHDVAALDPSFAEYFTKPGRVAAEWTNRVLTPEHKTYLQSLPYTVQTELVTFVHAGPFAPGEWEYVQSLPGAEKQFGAFKTQLCFIGHTHIPMVCGENLKTFIFKKGMRYLINVGSIGQPRDGNPQLSFGIFDTELWTYEGIRIDYDIRAAVAAITEAKLPPMLGQRLFEGQ
ncbi:MAG: metallophosphoesterase family protein [bacterium]